MFHGRSQLCALSHAAAWPQILDATEPFERDVMAPFRMPIIDKYKEMGTIVMGKSESGLVTVGDKLMVMPNKCAPNISVLKPCEDLVC